MKNTLVLKLLSLSVVLWVFTAENAWSYPDFIGYGYSSCITCHYSGFGGGALSDYGRALYAGEITARDIYAANKDNEEISNESGFLGSKPMPWWVRPGVKYRGLWLKTDPGSKATMERYINMQSDVNLTFFLDKKQNYTLVTTTSYTALEGWYGKTNTWYAREYYLRWKWNNNLWFYIGQLDKVFGIKTADHTAVNRAAITLGQYDQSQSAIVHFTYPNWDIAVDAFFGNGDQKESEKQKGFSASGEYQVFDKFKLGGSVLSSESDLAKWKLAAVTSRMGLSKGSSVMAEVGLKEKTDLVAKTDATLGSYALLETLVNVRRGYNMMAVFEHSKSNIKESSAENSRLSFGALLFPLPRLELRMMATNGKSFVETQGADDAWALQGQVHVSY